MQETQFKPSHFCWICGNTVALESCGTDEHGMAVHEECYCVKVALAKESERLIVRKPAHGTTAFWYLLSGLGQPVPCKIMPNRTEVAIQCPHCRVGDESRPMVEHIKGWFRCESCGHNEVPLAPGFRCSCSKCNASERQRYA